MSDAIPRVSFVFGCALIMLAIVMHDGPGTYRHKPMHVEVKYERVSDHEWRRRGRLFMEGVIDAVHDRPEFLRLFALDKDVSGDAK